MILGKYGVLPMGWPADWVYVSAFGDEWKRKMAERSSRPPLEILQDEDLEQLRANLAAALGKEPSGEEFILYLMHPKDALEFIKFRESYGESPLVLPTDVWRNGLHKPGGRVEFEFWGKPCSIELVSIGGEHQGSIHVVMRVNNQTRVYAVDMPGVKPEGIRTATGPNEVASPLNGNLWRIGNPRRGPLKVGDIVHKGEEIANIEAMKMENAVCAPFDGQIDEISVKLNDIVGEGQMLFALKQYSPAVE